MVHEPCTGGVERRLVQGQYIGMKKRVHAYYTGYVQGVGFRFTAEDIALSLKLTGWVKNLPDGGVEVVCEGEEPVIEDFLERLDSRMKRYVKKRDIEWEKYQGEFKDFDIRFY